MVRSSRRPEPENDPRVASARARSDNGMAVGEIGFSQAGIGQLHSEKVPVHDKELRAVDKPERRSA